ncbi:hypothetical protein [Helicobacter rodentium]|uniref:hypothetical protein n=1 Tax=Helicobacter rodentium TaxID=59617 RepID=UPI0025A4DFAA|nr:hypothetical protein [Helicobacter rodentium]
MTKTTASLRGMSKANDEAIYNNEKRKISQWNLYKQDSTLWTSYLPYKDTPSFTLPLNRRF